MKVDSSGNLLVGTTTGYSKLSVWSAASGDGSRTFEVTDSASSSKFYVTNTGSTTMNGVLTVNGTGASSTFANGINLTGGCFAINNVCVSGGGGTWGSITGTLSSQTDLQTALNLKTDNSTTSLPLLLTLAGLVSFGSSSATTTALGNLKATSDLTVSGNSYLGTIKTGTWNGTSIADAYIDDNITASNYLSLASWFGTTSAPELGSLTRPADAQSQEETWCSGAGALRSNSGLLRRTAVLRYT